MQRGVLAGAELPGGLDDDADAQLAPVDRGGVTLGCDRYVLPPTVSEPGSYPTAWPSRP